MSFNLILVDRTLLIALTMSMRFITALSVNTHFQHFHEGFLDSNWLNYDIKLIGRFGRVASG